MALAAPLDARQLRQPRRRATGKAGAGNRIRWKEAGLRFLLEVVLEGLLRGLAFVGRVALEALTAMV